MANRLTKSDLTKPRVSLACGPSVVNRILVAVANDARSESTATRAADLARQLHAEIVLLNVSPSAYSTSSEFICNELDRRCHHMKDATAALESLKSKIMPDLTVETLLREGDPVTEILKAAADSNADLIVIGAPARQLLARVMAGDLAHAIMLKATCPVVAVPPHKPG